MKHTTYLIILIVSISIFSCTEKVDIELDSTYERVVIEGYLTSEYKNHQVKISKSADYFSNKPAEPITGADVSITDGIFTYPLTEAQPGIYKTEEMSGVPGITYTLNINIEGEHFSASDYMHSCPPIDSIKFKRFENDSNHISISIFAQEPEEEINHYAWKAYRNDTLVTDTLREIFFSDDILINGSYINDVNVQYIKAKNNDIITLEMLSITKPYYEYMIKVMLETDWDGGPFDGPPANFYGNISNEALGFFAVYSVEQKTAMLISQ
jgi:hypothetical protein